MTQDENYLNLLSIFHYVVGGIAALFALFPVIHVILGLAFVFAADEFEGSGPPPPAFIGWIFVVVAGVAIAFGLTISAFILTSGRFLAKRRHYMFCLVMGGVECIFMPLGTVLGAFTIIVLMRESVKKLFENSGP